MANTSAWITAGLPFPKEGEAQTVGEVSAYITAGLPKEVEGAPAFGGVSQVIGGGIVAA